MAAPAAYFLILNEAGLPFYSQSFEFESVQKCRFFGGRVVEAAPKNEDYLMASYFSAMQLYASDVMQAELNLFGLGFTNFKIEGVVKNGIFFIGIFDDTIKPIHHDNRYDMIAEIANRFLEAYPFAVSMHDAVIYDQFSDFTARIVDLFEIDGYNSFRDCIAECSDSHKGCVPHHFFYKKLSENQDNTIPLKLADDPQPSNGTKREKIST